MLTPRNPARSMGYRADRHRTRAPITLTGETLQPYISLNVPKIKNINWHTLTQPPGCPKRRGQLRVTSNRELAKIQLPTLKMDVPIPLVAHQAHRSSAARPGFVMCGTIVRGVDMRCAAATVGLSVAAGDKRRALEQTRPRRTCDQGRADRARSAACAFVCPLRRKKRRLAETGPGTIVKASSRQSRTGPWIRHRGTGWTRVR